MSTATFYKPTYKVGKSKTAKVYPGEIPAITLVAINRYNCGMTVGHGWYRKFSHTDQIQSTCQVLGWFSDGRVSVSMPHGGYGILGTADVQITSWPDYVPEERRAEWLALPQISRVQNNEMVLDTF